MAGAGPSPPTGDSTESDSILGEHLDGSSPTAMTGEHEQYKSSWYDCYLLACTRNDGHTYGTMEKESDNGDKRPAEEVHDDVSHET